MHAQTEPVGTVAALARYPVKSMGGEAPASVRIGPRGVEHDRWWAVYTEDGHIGSGKTTRRFRRVDGLLEHRARVEDGRVTITSSDGEEWAVDDPGASAALCRLLGRAVRLREEDGVPHHDESPLHVVTTAALRRLGELVGEPVDARRCRANIVLDVEGSGFLEDGWHGRLLRIGDDGVVLRLGGGMPRCVMVGAAQDGLPHDARVLRRLAEHHDLELGLVADVLTGGTVRTGDIATLLPSPGGGGGAPG